MEKFINLLQSIFIHELFLLITVSPIVLIQFMNVDSSIQTYDLIKSNPILIEYQISDEDCLEFSREEKMPSKMCVKRKKKEEHVESFYVEEPVTNQSR